MKTFILLSVIISTFAISIGFISFGEKIEEPKKEELIAQSKARKIKLIETLPPIIHTRF